MGKKYYCEYCEKSFKDDKNIRKTHLEGLPHQKARNEYYAQYKSAEEILNEEQKKKPCSKFPSGTCQFGSTCRFSHYSRTQLLELQQQVNFKKQQDRLKNQDPKMHYKQMIDEFMQKRKLNKEQIEKRYLREFFDYPAEFLKKETELPPSLRPFDPELLKQVTQINSYV